MKSIFGRINIDHKTFNQFLFLKSIDQLSVFPKIKKKTKKDFYWGFGQINFPPFNRYNPDELFEESEYIIVSDSFLYNKKELAEKLNITQEYITDENLIFHAYKKWGINCVYHFLGDFSFAIWNHKTEELFCARDHFGVKPFHYYFDQTTFVFSSDIAAITEQKDLSFTINEQYIADSISLIKSDTSRTTYNEIKKLPPAHYLLLKKGKPEIKKYWELEARKTIEKREVEIVENFKYLLTDSVKRRVGEDFIIGSELSGGIDSSSVTAIANSLVQVKSFSHILPDDQLGKIHPFKDERDFIKILCDFCKIRDQHFIKSEEISLIDSLKQNVNDFKNISQQNFGIFSDHLYKTAMEKNVSVLLSGFGGDEVVTSQSLNYINELAQNKQWKELKTDLLNQKKKKQYIKLRINSGIPFISKVISCIRYKSPWWLKKFENLALNKDFSSRLDIRGRYFKYHQNLKRGLLQEKSIERITHPHVSQRLEYCSIIARKYGIEYRYPLLDKRLIEFYLAMPTRLKARNGIGRYAIRKVIEGIVPEKIQWRNDKSGVTIPTVFMRMLNDKEKITEIIKSAKLNPLISQYIDFNKYEKWFYNLCHRSKEKQKFINPGAFYNYLKLILFIDQNPSLFE